MRIKSVEHQYVEYIPNQLEQGILYISKKYNTVSHLCCCGCGEKVVTPLKPTDWSLSEHGDSISIYPSIGNWSFNCKSHYWIKRNKVVWAPQWSNALIHSNRMNGKLRKQQYYESNRNKVHGITIVINKIIRIIKTWLSKLFL